MKAKFGMIVVDGRGKLGGHVLSKNRGGAYARTKVTPVNPDTTDQTQVRADFTSLSQAWRALTEAQRTAWNAAVDNFTSTDVFGDIKRPSGFNLYKKLNGNLDAIAEARITTPPLPGTAVGPETIALISDVSDGTVTLSWTGGNVPAGTTWIVEATAQVSAGKSFVKNLFRAINLHAAATASPQLEFATYTAKFGGLSAGTKIFVRVTPVTVATGIRGQALQTSAIVTA